MYKLNLCAGQYGYHLTLYQYTLTQGIIMSLSIVRATRFSHTSVRSVPAFTLVRDYIQNGGQAWRSEFQQHFNELTRSSAPFVTTITV